MLSLISTLHRLLHNNSELKPLEVSNTNECKQNILQPADSNSTYTIKAMTTQATEHPQTKPPPHLKTLE